MKYLIALMASLAVINCAPQKANVEGETSVADTTVVDSTHATKKVTIDMLKTKKEKIGYALGLQIGNSLKGDVDGQYDLASVFLGMNDEITDVEKKMSQDQIQKAMTDLNSSIQEKRNSTFAGNKTKGEKFLTENLKDSTVKATNSGLQYKVLVEGDQETYPKATDEVTVHYVGTLLDGKEFDSSVKRGTPATFKLNRVISGWTEGVQLMSKGAKYRFFIPYNLAYGERGAGGDIGPFETLIFDVELLDIK